MQYIYSIIENIHFKSTKEVLSVSCYNETVCVSMSYNKTSVNNKSSNSDSTSSGSKSKNRKRERSRTSDRHTSDRHTGDRNGKETRLLR